MTMKKMTSDAYGISKVQLLRNSAFQTFCCLTVLIMDEFSWKIRDAVGMHQRYRFSYSSSALELRMTKGDL